MKRIERGVLAGLPRIRYWPVFLVCAYLGINLLTGTFLLASAFAGREQVGFVPDPFWHAPLLFIIDLLR
jgi:hypothetical protein